MDQMISHTINVNKHGNGEIGSSYKEDVPNHLESQMIDETVSSMKVESIHGTPNKSPLLKSPIFKKGDKSVQSVDTDQTSTCQQRKRTISVNSDYNTFKLELCNTEMFNNFEDIDLLHDLDSIVEDSKDLFLSSMMDINMIQEDDSLLGMSKDPATDPLSISDCEKKDTQNIDTLTDSDAKFSERCRIKVESKPQIKRQKTKHLKKRKHKLNTAEKCILEELENLQEWEEVPLIVIKKLLNLRIKLIHEVPPQHKIELSGSHAPTKRAKTLFQKHGPIRSGAYTPTEDNIIKRNWKMFCKHHDWDTNKTQQFLYWRHDGRYYIHDVKERQKFVQFLANGLPWRTLYSVYSRFKILYRNKITYARYTRKEDKKILMYIQSKNLDERDTKYAELAKLLRRTNRSIFKRYQYLKKTQAKSKMRLLWTLPVRWTLPLIKRFIKTLLNVTLSEDIRELEDATLPKPVWQKIEDKLGIHKNISKTFWQHQLHLQLFSTGPIYLNDIKILLIEYMYGKGISNTREIIWSNVARYFDGATAVFLCKTFFYLVQECNLNDMDNFADVVKYLYHNKIPEIQKAPTDKFLPRIMYKNGKISLLNAENSKTITTETNYEETDSTSSSDSTDSTSDSDC